MPTYDITVPITGEFGLTVEAACEADALAFAEALAERAMTTEGLLDDSVGIAEAMGLSVDMQDFCISGGPATSKATIEEVRGS